MTNSTDTASADASSNGGNGPRRAILIVLFLIFALIGGAWGAYWYFEGRFHESTDDAYVGGTLVSVNSQVSGTVIEVLADDNQYVEEGQPLARLDEADADVAMEQAKTALAEIVRQVRQQFANVEQYEAGVAQRRIELARARDDLERRRPLLARQAVSAEEIAHAESAIEAAAAALRVADGQLVSARTLVDNTSVPKHPSIERARANFRQVFLAAKRNLIVAPISGHVVKRSVQVGQRLAPGTPLLAIVPLEGLWIDANYKERDLTHIRIGQPAKVIADIYGSKVEYAGKVGGIAAGTGSAFALLPPQNASGNWIKVVQRVPVRIVIRPEDLKRAPLRVGLSTTVDVDTHDRDGEVLALAPVRTTVSKTRVFEQLSAEADRIADAIVRANLPAAPAAPGRRSQR